MEILKKVNIVYPTHAYPEPSPQYATVGSAGIDIRSTENCFIEAGNYRLVKTGLRIQLPIGYEAQIRPRSGLAYKKGVTVLNSPGTIDSDYRGEIGVILINHGKSTFHISAGDRIAQMVIAKYVRTELVLKESLEDTERGEGGFGSTGEK